jgi:hypothetical protein
MKRIAALRVTKNAFYTISMLPGLLLLAATVSFAQDDVKGGKDHPLFTRMPNYRISDYQEKDSLPCCADLFQGTLIKA